MTIDSLDWSTKTNIALENTADKGLFALQEGLMRRIVPAIVVASYILIKLFTGTLLDPSSTVKERPRRIKIYGNRSQSITCVEGNRCIRTSVNLQDRVIR